MFSTEEEEENVMRGKTIVVVFKYTWRINHSIAWISITFMSITLIDRSKCLCYYWSMLHQNLSDIWSLTRKNSLFLLYWQKDKWHSRSGSLFSSRRLMEFLRQPKKISRSFVEESISVNDWGIIDPIFHRHFSITSTHSPWYVPYHSSFLPHVAFVQEQLILLDHHSVQVVVSQLFVQF